jgi:hypothetical protein
MLRGSACPFKKMAAATNNKINIKNSFKILKNHKVIFENDFLFGIIFMFNCNYFIIPPTKNHLN